MLFRSIGIRIVQSALMAGVFVLVLGQLNGNRRREKQRIAPDADERNQAEMIMESSGLAGEPCTVSFYEDSFQLENPGITTSYRYEGVSWIKETEQYYMIFWTRSTVIPVEKAGFYRGTPSRLLLSQTDLPWEGPVRPQTGLTELSLPACM